VICQKLKRSSETETLPVILISASHNVSDTLKQSGAPNDFIAKPFDIEYLISRVKNQFAA
jgi:DNA-binding response OmpR family regulator